MKVPDRDQQAERKPHQAPVRFGVTSADREAVTRDLSSSGLFVLTDSPLEPGTPIQLRLSLDACSLPMRGVVTWNRDEEAESQPGMGVNLVRPPALYAHFVSQIK